MKTALCIQAHPTALEAINVCLPSWRDSGFDLIGIDGPDEEINWPKCFKETMKLIGDWDGIRWSDNPKLFHAMRLRDTILYLSMLFYDRYIITEYDSIMLSEPRGIERGKLGAFIAGYCPESWGCGDGPFLHPPFVCDSETLECLADEVFKMGPDEDVGNGTPDVFMAILCKRAGIEIYQPEGVWSTNGLDMRMKSKLIEARSAVNSGCWHIHGIKRQDHLDFIMSRTEEFPKDVITE